jgi:glycosyltransferase involved in cell wall biosynthesis
MNPKLNPSMKLGKPVIGTRSGGTPELVQEGAAGFLYEPGDANELANRIA